MSGNGPDRLSSETSYLSHICICPFVRGLAAMAGRAQISTGAPGCFLDNPFTGPLRALNFRPGKKEARRITGEDLTRHLDSFVPLPLAQFLRENVATRENPIPGHSVTTSVESCFREGGQDSEGQEESYGRNKEVRPSRL
jgi:hypothetical protein